MRDEARDGVCGLTSSREREALGLPTGMGDVSALTAQLRELQAELVGALQAEYFCDDLAPPADALGWSERRLRDYFESGGGAAAEAAPPAAADAAARAAVVPGQPGGGRHQPAVEAAGGTAVDMPSL